MNIKIFFLILTLGFATYSFSLNNAFVFDDEEHVQHNSAIHEIENVPSFFFTSTINQGTPEKMSGIYYKPLLMTTYAAVWSLFGGDPFSFHILQIFLHCANAFLIFILFASFTTTLPALLLALVFLLHPLNTENSVYISNYQDILFTLFGLIALMVLRASSPRWWHHVSVALLLLASLLCKESGVLFITAAALYVFIFRPPARIRSMLAIASSVGAYAFLRFGLAGLYNVFHGVAPVSRITALERFFTSPAALLHYFKLLFLPFHFTTAQNWVVTEPGLFDFWVPFALVVLAFAVVIYWNRKHPSKPLLYFSLCLGAGLFLHSQLLAPLDATVADRWFYFPMFAFLGMLTVAIPWSRLKRQHILMVAVPLLALLSVRSFVRSLDWKSGYTLYKHDLELAPDAYDIQNNFGVELFRRSEYDEAMKHFLRSTELAPHWTINWNNLGAAYEKFGNLDKAESAYCRSVNNGVYYLAFENYAGLLIKKNLMSESLGFIEDIGLVGLPGSARLTSFRDYLRTLNVTAKRPTLPLSCPQS